MGLGRGIRRRRSSSRRRDEGTRKAFDSSFALVRLFTEDLDRRWLARNEGSGKREGGRDPERRDRNRKVPRVDARRARRGDAEEGTSQSGGEEGG